MQPSSNHAACSAGPHPTTFPRRLQMATALPPWPAPPSPTPSPRSKGRPASPPRGRAAAPATHSPHELHPGRRQRGRRRRRLFRRVRSGGWGPARAACPWPAAPHSRRLRRRSLRRGEARRPARGFPCVGGRGRGAAEPYDEETEARQDARAAPAPASRRDALWESWLSHPLGIVQGFFGEWRRPGAGGVRASRRVHRAPGPGPCRAAPRAGRLEGVERPERSAGPAPPALGSPPARRVRAAAAGPGAQVPPTCPIRDSRATKVTAPGAGCRP